MIVLQKVLYGHLSVIKETRDQALRKVTELLNKEGSANQLVEKLAKVWAELEEANKFVEAAKKLAKEVNKSADEANKSVEEAGAELLKFRAEAVEEISMLNKKLDDDVASLSSAKGRLLML